MFNKLKTLAADPILGLMTAFRDDKNPCKVDLSVGVFKDEEGNTPIFKAVKMAEDYRLKTETTKAYIGMIGTPGFNDSIQHLMLGNDHSVITNKRIASAMTPGGSGALRVAAELIKRAKPDAKIWVSDPTWANHVPLISGVGFEMKTYPYFDKVTHSVKVDAMLETLKTLGRGDVVLLHGACHNPTGADLSPEAWDAIAEIACNRGFTPFIDCAYQGLGDGLDEDAYGTRKLADSVEEMLLAMSCSKNFGLYRDRVGMVAAITASDKQPAALSQIMSVARGMYSMPPAHGGAIVEHILTTPELDIIWRAELEGICSSIQHSRHLLADGLNNSKSQAHFNYLKTNKGMFSHLDLTPDQIDKLRGEHSVYIVGSGRINLAGVTASNIDYLVAALEKVMI